MYRVIFIVLIHVAFSLGCRPPPCHWHDPTPIVNYFNTVAHKVIAADRKAEEFCNRQGSYMQEVHAQTEYKIVIPGHGGSYDIKVRDRILLILAENCENSMAELRILPPYVNGYGGHYCTATGDLVITFPFHYDAAVGGGTCEVVNRNPVSLYQSCR